MARTVNEGCKLVAENFLRKIAPLVMGICWPLRTKTLAHEMRSGGARPRLADAIARVISESRVVEGFEASLAGSIMVQINWEEVQRKWFPTTQLRTMAGHWSRVAPITRDQWPGQSSAVNNEVHSMIRQGRNGPGCNLRYKWEESISHYRQLERFNRCIPLGITIVQLISITLPVPWSLASNSWEEWRIRRKRLRITVKHLLSDATTIPNVQILSITSPLPCPLDSSGWEEWRI